MRFKARPFSVEIKRKSRKRPADAGWANPPQAVSDSSVHAAPGSAVDKLFRRPAQTEGEGGHVLAAINQPPISVHGEPAIRILPDLSRLDPPEDVPATRKAAKARSGRPRLSRDVPVAETAEADDALEPVASLDSELTPTLPVAAVGRQTNGARFRWSGRQIRASKVDDAPLATRPGERWKRRLPKPLR